MPEAVKETEAEAPVPQSNEEKVVTCGKLVEDKPSVACSGTLPAEEETEMKMEIEGEKAPPLDEQKPEESSTIDEKPTKAQIQELLEKGREAVAKHDYYNAADHFGKACEFSAKLYGDMATECAENYFLYGSAMLECGKVENTVLGEKVKDEADEEDEDDQDEDNEASSDKQNGEGQGEQEKDISEEKDVSEEKDNSEHENGENKADSTIEEKAGPSSDEVKENDETIDGTEEKEEDEDSSLKVAWEMFELAKVIFEKSGNEKRLADTFMKLGEVGIESGHKTAMEDMKKGLEVRMKLYPGERIVSETHFNIGLAFSMFQMFDDAINHFELCRSILKTKIDQLRTREGNDVKDEIKEIEDLLPDLEEKIQDMKESKKIHEEEMLKKEESTKEEMGEKQKSDATVPVSNISHLVKRKRKLDEVTSDLSPEENRKSKLVCKEEEKTTETEKNNTEEKDAAQTN